MCGYLQTRNQDMKEAGLENTLNYVCAIQDIGKVKQYLKDVKKTVLNKKYSCFGTALNIACEDGNIEVVKALVEAGADLEIRNNGKNTPLLVALQYQNEEVARYLIDKGADVMVTGLHKMSALHFACNACSVQMVNILLEKGCDINQQDAYKRSVLCDAVNGSREVVELLIKKGIDKGYITPAFIHACRMNKVEIANLLVSQGADVESVYMRKSELLYDVCGFGNVEIVKFLLKQGVDFQTFKRKAWDAPEKESPLEFAIRCKQDEVVSIIQRFKKS